MHFNMSSRILNDDLDENNQIIPRRDFNCGGCGQRARLGFRYLLCDRCLKDGLPAKSVHRTSRDHL